MQQRNLVIFIILAGAVLRCIWPMDMEWKFDEQEMFRLAGDAWKNGFPLMGMPSGAGLPNAGFSVWPFALLYGIHPTPLFMGMGVQWLNVLALCLMVYCALQYEHPFRNILLWGLAAYAVSIMPVLFSRKIWAQDLLPLFVAGIWWCYLNRHKGWILSLLGLVLVLAGQLHLSGFFYAAGFGLALLLFGRLRLKDWGWIAAGALPGLLLAIKWIQVITQQGGGISHLNNIFKLEFWLRLLTDTPGINIYYTAAGEVSSFAKYPLGLHLPLMLAVGIVVFILYAVIKRLASGIKRPAKGHPLMFLLLGFVVFPGLLMTFSGIPVRSHYMIGALPFGSMAIAWFMDNVRLKKLRLQLLWVIMQLVFTVLFLIYVHQKQVIHGDYGSTYRLQQKR